MESHAESTPPDPRIGAVIQDRYRIIRKLGDGGMGTVYEGEHLIIKKRVAIKVLHAQFAQKPEIVARFHREAEAATAIGHPNIVEVNDFGRFADGAPYMVLEFLRGRDWSKDIQDEGPQPLGKVVHILTQVCDALDAAHAKGIVHRDMKPENIFLMQRGNDPAFAKVVDFGISKIFDPSGENHSLTQTGTALGTPYYMAPEQCQGKKDLDPRADIYSLGVILFQALTRRYPFDDESYPMLVLKICTEPPPLISHYRTDLPPQIQEMLNRMLAKDRAHRFMTCSEVKAWLEPFRHYSDAPAMVANAPSLAGRDPSVLAVGPAKTPSGTAYLLDVTPSPPAQMEPAPPPKRSLLPILAIGGAVGALALAGAVLGVVLAFSGSGERDVATTQTNAAPVVPPAIEPPAPPPETANVPAQPPPAPIVEPVVAQSPTIHLLITTVPSNARMTLDGDPIGNPFNGTPDRDPPLAPGATRTYHILRVEAPGYRPDEQELAFRFDQTLTIELERGDVNNVRHVRAQPEQPAVQPMVQNPPPPPPRVEPVEQPTRRSGNRGPDIFGNGGGAQPQTGQTQQGTGTRGTVGQRTIFQ